MDPNLSAETSPAPKKAKTCQKYYPKPGSGGYAILIALYQNQDDDRGYLTKSELCDLAQKFCNESMTQPDQEEINFIQDGVPVQR